MSMLFFTFRAQIKAQRAVHYLLKQGIPTKIGKTPGHLAQRGCGYGIWLNPQQGSDAGEKLKRAGITYEKAYIMDGDNVRELSL